MKKGMEENGQRTDPGTDGRQEQEDAVLRGQLQQALDSVEPDGRRGNGCCVASGKRRLPGRPPMNRLPCPHRNRHAAARALGAASAVRASDRRLPVHPDDYALACAGSRPPASRVTVAIGSLPPLPLSALSDRPLDAAGLSLSLPEGAGNVSSTLVDGQIACVYFVMDGKAYALYASRLEGDFFGLDGDIVETEQITGTFSAILQKVRPLLPSKENPIPSSPGEEATTSAGEPSPVGIPGAYQAVWEADGVRYYLCATNGASADDVLTVVRQLMPGRKPGTKRNNRAGKRGCKNSF